MQDIINRTNLHSQDIEDVKKGAENLNSHLQEQLAKFEDVIDKKINSEIIPRIGHIE